MNDRFDIREITTPGDWRSARAIRRQVFIEEQSCPAELEWDRYDPISRHYLGLLGETPIATARWRVVDHENERWARLERLAVVPDQRSQKYGSRLFRHLLREAERAGIPACLIHAQAHLTDLYRRFGFEVVGDPFEEAGIRHRRMIRRT